MGRLFSCWLRCLVFRSLLSLLARRVRSLVVSVFGASRGQAGNAIVVSQLLDMKADHNATNNVGNTAKDCDFSFVYQRILNFVVSGTGTVTVG